VQKSTYATPRRVRPYLPALISLGMYDVLQPLLHSICFRGLKLLECQQTSSTLVPARVPIPARDLPEQRTPIPIIFNCVSQSRRVVGILNDQGRPAVSRAFRTAPSTLSKTRTAEVCLNMLVSGCTTNTGWKLATGQVTSLVFRFRYVLMIKD
jgi:hypothetical protein